MAGYTKEFLVEAFMSRYTSLAPERFVSLRKMADEHYDQVGKDKFRLSASLDAEAIKLYKAKEK